MSEPGYNDLLRKIIKERTEGEKFRHLKLLKYIKGPLIVFYCVREVTWENTRDNLQFRQDS